MTPADLRALADAADARGLCDAIAGELDSPDDSRLIALAPDLARLCAEMGEALEQYAVPVEWDGLAAAKALAKLTELGAR